MFKLREFFSMGEGGHLEIKLKFTVSFMGLKKFFKYSLIYPVTGVFFPF